ncbi:MAG: prepilin-type N-terminal cleavage/methylation domain-containing protein [Polyangiaceae bacterium]
MIRNRADLPKRAAKWRLTRAAFSLLEVMVAVAILGLALSVILSAQGGLAASNRRAANMGNAVNYGRCKITETEEKMLKLGYPPLDSIEQDQPCCNDESGKFRCDTRVEKIILPIPPQNTLEGGAALALGSATAAAGVASNAPGGLINNPLGTGAGLNFDGGTGLAGIGNQLNAATGGQGAAGLIGMVMSFLYPQLKLLFEAAIRRVTVTVRWSEGVVPRDVELVEYITNPALAGFVAGIGAGGDGGVSPVGSSGTTTPGAAATSQTGVLKTGP